MNAYHTPRGIVSTLYLDMLEQPHLLIAGSTGSGKSTAIQGLICAALLDSPNKRRFILIDPKRVELADYAELPHTIEHAAGFNPEAWQTALNPACQIMDCRYADMERRHIRTYDGPHVYVIIDEWANVYRNGGRAAYNAVMRLSSEGRAARVHVVLATQVPNTRILPSEIRENMTARLCLRTNTRTESRVLMDVNGCETLPQYGEGWYITPNGRTLYRIPYTSDAERDRLIRHWTQPAWKPRTA